MIIEKLLFIHIPKNSGTSIEATLDKKYNTSMSSIYSFFTKNTPNIIKYVLFNKPLFVYKYLNILLNFIKYNLSNNSFIYNSKYFHTFPIHYKASHMHNIVSNYSEFITFAIIRNPYSRAISLFVYTHPVQWITVENFNLFLDNLIINKLQMYTTFFDNQKSYIMDENNKQIVTNILKFENLNSDWDEFSQKNDLNLPILSKLNVNSMSSTKTAKLLTDVTREKIYLIYKEDFVYFNYDK